MHGVNLAVYLGSCLNHIALGNGQERISDVEDHDGKRGARQVPCFMLDGIVKYPRFAWNPFSSGNTHSEPTIRGNNHRQVHR